MTNKKLLTFIKSLSVDVSIRSVAQNKCVVWIEFVGRSAHFNSVIRITILQQKKVMKRYYKNSKRLFLTLFKQWHILDLIRKTILGSLDSSLSADLDFSTQSPYSFLAA